MNGSDELFVDTNLFIYYFGGINAAKQALRDKKLHFSFITEIELLGSANISYAQEKMIKEVLSFQTKHSYLPEIERMTIAIKKAQKIKIPDAIIAATAIVNDIPLLTSDKAFSRIKDLRCVVFEI